MTDLIQVPDWIDISFSPNDIAAVNQGGCASGAYMPAVEYYTASRLMAEHGDDVLDYLQNYGAGELPKPPNDISWSGLACFYLSYAVELFCALNSHLEDWENEEPLGYVYNLKRAQS